MKNALANAGKYSKFIVSFVATVSVGLTTEFPAAHWVPIVVAALGTVATYLVPNQSSTPTPATA